MAAIVWTEQAYEDLESIADYIRRDSENYARLFAKKILILSTGIN
jgi:plasmid stabilization system protein ParE